MREQPAEGAIVRMDRPAALLCMIFDMNRLRAVRVRYETRIRDGGERGHRHLDYGDRGQQHPAQDGASRHWHRNISEPPPRVVSALAVPLARYRARFASVSTGLCVASVLDESPLQPLSSPCRVAPSGRARSAVRTAGRTAELQS